MAGFSKAPFKFEMIIRLLTLFRELKKLECQPIVFQNPQKAVQN